MASQAFLDDGTRTATTFNADTEEVVARNLPELISELRKLRTSVESSSRHYKDLSSSRQDSPDELEEYTPQPSRYITSREPSVYFTRETETEASRSSYTFSKKAEKTSSLRSMGRRHHNTPKQQTNTLHQFSRSMSRIRSSTTVIPTQEYSATWISGECGISLRRLHSKTGVGAQIAVLQQVDGIVSGLTSCRLGDELFSVNGTNVHDWAFADIADKIGRLQRPITFSFRPPSAAPTSPPSSSRAHAKSTQPHYGGHDAKMYQSAPSRLMFSPFEEEASTDAEIKASGSVSSNSSGTTTVAEELELWCREQEELHAEILTLITDTVVRCESLQQERLDHVQEMIESAVPSDRYSNDSLEYNI